MIEPVELTYELELLPSGRIPFRRWRWALWHGAQLLAAGWRVSATHAQGAMRVHALRYAHRLHGLHPLRVEQAADTGSRWGGGPIAVEWGDLRVVLRPRALAGAAGWIPSGAGGGAASGAVRRSEPARAASSPAAASPGSAPVAARP